jgi:hypothetical protein
MLPTLTYKKAVPPMIFTGERPACGSGATDPIISAGSQTEEPRTLRAHLFACDDL